ncbi:MAG: OsmC family protein [Sphaerochaetaceae bacterium]|nr:OsmC family protein [Sphaerochaetaceae bacterium]MDC7247453.1 OsmC family protein [Sphaerochaetaceae bacterium]
MGETTHIRSDYNQSDGTLLTDRGSTVPLSNAQDGFAPYELLLGGLSFCLFKTYESIAQKMKFTYDGVSMDITGIKSDEKVALLKTVRIDVVAKGVEEKAKFTKAFEIATRYCSVFNTLSKIAEMKWDIDFQ